MVAPGQSAHRSTWSVLPASCAENVLPRHRPSMPSLDAVRASPHRPVVVTPDASVTGPTYDGSSDPARQLPINGGGFEVDSGMFKGRVSVHMRNLPTTDAAVFDGKRRNVHVAVQGRFKRRVRAGSLTTGQEFHMPIQGGAAVEWLLEQLLRACAKVFSKTTLVDAHCDQPYFLNPVLAACQLVNVAKPGHEPNAWAAEEDCRLLSPQLADDAGGPLAADRRRKWCDEPRNVEGLWFETGYVYTFHVWQHLLDFGTYKANAGGFVSFDLTWVLSSQPIGIMVKDCDSGDYAYSVLVWHERLLYPEEAAREQKAKAAEERAAARAAAAAAGGAGGGAGAALKAGVRGFRFWA